MNKTEKRMKIGIACGCRKLNYGSILQSYALCEAVKKNGYDCHFIWIRGNLFKHYNIRIGKILGVVNNTLIHPSIFPRVIKSVKGLASKKTPYAMSNESKRMFEQFKKDNLEIKHFSWNELKKKDANYAKFICGSDQIWNSYEYYLDPMYFLRFTTKDKRIAYAPSFGTDSISYYNKATLKNYLSGFEMLSVRESSGKNICKELTGKDVHVVLDPTLLLTKEEWIDLQNLTYTNSNEEYCLVYFLSYPSQSAVHLIKQLRISGIKLKAIPINYDCYNEKELINAGPREFLELLLNAKYVITDSFHGTIFSVNFQKKFICFERQYASKVKQSTRITDILNKLHLSGRYNVESPKMMDVLVSDIDYKNVGNELKKLRSESKDYLINSLSS